MLLELLSAVDGLLGGPDVMLVLDADRIISSGPGGAARRAGGGPICDAGVRDRGGPAGGALARPRSGCEVGFSGGGVEVIDRGALRGPLGGGGVAFFVVSSDPPFLLTQRFKSGSK